MARTQPVRQDYRKGPPEIRIEAGADTEELKNFIFQQLSDEEAAQIDLRQERSAAPGLAREPVTIAITLVIGAKMVAESALAATLVVTIGSLIERWMDQRAEAKARQQAIDIYPSQPELSELLLRHLDRFSSVSIRNELKPPTGSE